MTESLADLRDEIEALLARFEAHLDAHPSARIRNAVNQARWLVGACDRELGAGKTVVIERVISSRDREERYDEHEQLMTDRLIDAGELPVGSTPADFRRWQESRAKKLQAIPSIEAQEAGRGAHR